MRITVSDHGCGIASEFAPFIFDKFSQADTSDTKAKGGTGLGLALALAIAQHMQLQLSFDSVVGQGSRFYLDVPLAQ
jgi:signal transduction histidine kinase